MKYSKELINFFKDHNMYDEKMINYLEGKTRMYDYRDDDYRPRCYVLIINGIIKDIDIIIPYDDNDITRVISIHEIVHGMVAYKNLKKKYNLNKRWEVLPFLYEELYYLENPSEELKQYLDYLDSCIDEDSEEKYIIAKAIREEMLSYYEDDFNKMDRLSKILTLKYSIFHR